MKISLNGLTPSIPQCPEFKMSGGITDPIDLTQDELTDLVEYLDYLSELKSVEKKDLFKKARCHLLCSHCEPESEKEEELNVWTKFGTLLKKLNTKNSAAAILFAALSTIWVSSFLGLWD